MSGEPRILDLNAVIPDDIFVEVGEDEQGNPKRYPFPGDAPMEDLLRLMIKADELDTATGKTPAELLELREEVTDDVDQLFRLRSPDLEEDEMPVLSDSQIGALLVGLMRIYSDMLAEVSADDEGGARPTKTPPKSKSAKRSRTSSARRRRPKAASGSSTSSQT